MRWTVSFDLVCLQRATEKTLINPGAAKTMTAWLSPPIQKRLLKRQVMGSAQTHVVWYWGQLLSSSLWLTFALLSLGRDFTQGHTDSCCLPLLTTVVQVGRVLLEQGRPTLPLLASCG